VPKQYADSDGYQHLNIKNLIERFAGHGMFLNDRTASFRMRALPVR
jgi:hypothetical protein